MHSVATGARTSMPAIPFGRREAARVAGGQCESRRRHKWICDEIFAIVERDHRRPSASRANLESFLERLQNRTVSN
jgi:hypothetical protein